MQSTHTALEEELFIGIVPGQLRRVIIIQPKVRPDHNEACLTAIILSGSEIRLLGATIFYC